MTLLAAFAGAQAVPRTTTRAPEPTPAGLATIRALDLDAEAERASEDDRARAAAFQRLAAGVDHAEWAVRLRAIELLAAARERDLAVERLIAAAGRLGADVEKRRRALAPPPKPLQPPERGADVFADLDETVEHARESLARVRLFIEETNGALAVAGAYRRAFVGMPAAPQRRGLLALQRSARSYDPELLRALLAVWDADVITALGDVHAATSTGVAQAAQALAKAKRQKPRGNPRSEKQRAAWLAAEQHRIDGEVAAAQARLDERERELAELEDVVSRFAREQGLPAPPRGAASAAWRSWAATARKAAVEREPK